MAKIGIVVLFICGLFVVTSLTQ